MTINYALLPNASLCFVSYRPKMYIPSNLAGKGHRELKVSSFGNPLLITTNKLHFDLLWSYMGGHKDSWQNFGYLHPSSEQGEKLQGHCHQSNPV